MRLTFRTDLRYEVPDTRGIKICMASYQFGQTREAISCAVKGTMLDKSQVDGKLYVIKFESSFQK